MWSLYFTCEKCQVTVVIGFNLKVQNNCKIVSVIKKVYNTYTHNEYGTISRNEDKECL